MSLSLRSAPSSQRTLEGSSGAEERIRDVKTKDLCLVSALPPTSSVTLAKSVGLSNS